jgi:RimJ/RimL family protein N-acetyltransferase
MFNKKDLEIKPISPEYYDENLELLNTTIKESHFLARDKDVSYEEGQAFIDTYLDHPNTIYLIALHNGKLIGHMFCIPRFEDLLLHTVIVGYLVHSDYRKQDIGSILMERLLNDVKKNGDIKILTAEVASDNVASQKLLMKYDFKEFGRLKNGLMIKSNEYVDLISFSKHL